MKLPFLSRGKGESMDLPAEEHPDRADGVKGGAEKQDAKSTAIVKVNADTRVQIVKSGGSQLMLGPGVLTDRKGREKTLAVREGQLTYDQAAAIIDRITDAYVVFMGSVPPPDKKAQKQKNAELATAYRLAVTKVKPDDAERLYAYIKEKGLQLHIAGGIHSARVQTRDAIAMAPGGLVGIAGDAVGHVAKNLEGGSVQVTKSAGYIMSEGGSELVGHTGKLLERSTDKLKNPIMYTVENVTHTIVGGLARGLRGVVTGLGEAFRPRR